MRSRGDQLLCALEASRLLPCRLSATRRHERGSGCSRMFARVFALRSQQPSGIRRHVRHEARLSRRTCGSAPPDKQDQDTRVEAAAAPTTHAALRLPCTVTVEHHRLSSSPVRPPCEVAREVARAERSVCPQVGACGGARSRAHSPPDRSAHPHLRRADEPRDCRPSRHKREDGEESCRRRPAHPGREEPDTRRSDRS
jgi:hypothetical protein